MVDDAGSRINDAITEFDEHDFKPKNGRRNGTGKETPKAPPETPEQREIRIAVDTLMKNKIQIRTAAAWLLWIAEVQEYNGIVAERPRFGGDRDALAEYIEWHPECNASMLDLIRHARAKFIENLLLREEQVIDDK